VFLKPGVAMRLCVAKQGVVLNGEQQECRNPCYTKMPKLLLGQSVENFSRKLQVSQKCRKSFTIVNTNKNGKFYFKNSKNKARPIKILFCEKFYTKFLFFTI
jgi:hypothetical protein